MPPVDNYDEDIVNQRLKRQLKDLVGELRYEMLMSSHKHLTTYGQNYILSVYIENERLKQSAAFTVDAHLDNYQGVEL